MDEIMRFVWLFTPRNYSSDITVIV